MVIQETSKNIQKEMKIPVEMKIASMRIPSIFLMTFRFNHFHCIDHPTLYITVKAIALAICDKIKF